MMLRRTDNAGVSVCNPCTQPFSHLSGPSILSSFLPPRTDDQTQAIKHAKNELIKMSETKKTQAFIILWWFLGHTRGTQGLLPAQGLLGCQD